MISGITVYLRPLGRVRLSNRGCPESREGVWKGRSPPSDNRVPGVSAERKIFINIYIYMHFCAFLTAGDARMGGWAPKGIHVFPGP